MKIDKYKSLRQEINVDFSLNNITSFRTEFAFGKRREESPFIFP